jgi:hypothetical protein
MVSSRWLHFVVTFSVENCSIFDGKIEVNTCKWLVSSGERESPPLRQNFAITPITISFLTCIRITAVRTEGFVGVCLRPIQEAGMLSRVFCHGS